MQTPSLTICVPRALLIVSALTTAASTTSPARADVNLKINAAVTHQTIEGYGATTISLIYNTTDNVPPALRTLAIDALYNQVKLNMGNLEVGPFESPAGNLYAPANDDNSPFTFNQMGFNWVQSDNMYKSVVQPGKPFGFNNFFLGPVISETYEFAWAKALRQNNYNAYLDECGEHVAAAAIHWRDAYGITPPLLQLWNEPIGGNGELAGGTVQEMVDIVKRAGARLRQEKFASMKFVVPADETEQRSLDEATAILSDQAARPYVGAIAYHPYPYGSTYASVVNILATSGSGMPDMSKVLVRNQLRDLGQKYGIPVFMVEVSHSEVPFGDFRGLQGRAIQIHDEFVYADAAAFFGMNAMWDTITNDQHYQGRQNPGLFAETDTIVLIDDTMGKPGKVYISEMGRAIGHYARFVPKGSVRLDAASDDPLVQVTAFRNDRDGQLALVVINNANAGKTLQLSLAGLTLETMTAVKGEQSTAGAYWQPVNGPVPKIGGYSVTVPPLSVTSLTSHYAVAPPADGGMGVSDGAVSDAAVVSDAAGFAHDLSVESHDLSVESQDLSVTAQDLSVTAQDLSVTAQDLTATPHADAADAALDAHGTGGCGCAIGARSQRASCLLAVLLGLSLMGRKRRRV